MENQSPPGASGMDRSKDSAQRVRRRNRMITSCLECRRRKLKCDKQQPCTNCQKFSRDCMFLAPALDSVSQKKLNEIKEKMGTLERTLEEDVAKRKANRNADDRRGSSDLPGEGSESDEGPVPEDEKGLEATPLAATDGAYEDDGDDNNDVLDLGFRVGKFRMTERLGGLFRPKLAEEMVFALVRDNKRGTEPEAPLKDDAETFLEPGPVYIAPGSGFLFGDTSGSRSIVDFLPTKGASDLLMRRYYNNCHFLAKVLHWPSYQIQYERFWTSILAGIEPSASLQALVFSVMFQAVASMSNAEIDSVFQQTHRQVLTQFQQATEISLGRANLLRTTKLDTLQAFILYLIPMCRGEISRAHSVLVGAAIRLGECFGLHRDPVEAFGYQPLEAQVRRLLWFQLCWLDFKTAEGQGPRPSIKREDYDTKLPWNLDDIDILQLQPGPTQPKVELREKEGQWTDATLTKIRFEANEMHRIVWHDRIRLDKGKVSITHVLGKIESFRRAMDQKYVWLDESITIQHYTKLVLELSLLRMHIMILHKYHNATATRIPDRLRQIILTSGTKVSEDAVILDRDPKFDNFRWYHSAFHQWHTAFLLLTEVFMFPNRKEADRIWSIADHVFEPDLTLTRVQKARSIMAAIRDRAAAYRNVRKMREPVSMRNRLNTTLPTRGRIRGPEMILPQNENADQAAPAQAIYQQVNAPHGKPSVAEDIPITRVEAPTPDPTTIVQTTEMPATIPAAAPGSWTFDSPYTLFTASGENRTQAPVASVSPQYHGVQHPNEPSPSNSSPYTESWPPNITSVQQATYQYNPNSASPPTAGPVSPPSDPSTSPPGPWVFGNSAMGLMSGRYIPPSQQRSNATDFSHSDDGSVPPMIAYNTSHTSSIASPSPSELIQNSSPSYHANLLAPQTQAPPRTQATPQIHSAWSAAQNQASAGGSATGKDVPMLDIDWTEWDKLFPVEINNGDLDVPVAQRREGQF